MSDDSKSHQKITGYLEKRGKLKLMNSWKRYWFVLEGHLLLYYASKEDHDALSPCKGSITLGPTCTVKPYASTPSKFQITTRSGCVTTLRAESISEQNRWMQAIFSTVNENQKVDISPTKLCHFRYSTERVDLILNNADTNKSNSPQIQTESEKPPSKPSERDETHLLERLQRIGARSYCDSVIPTQQKSFKKPKKPRELEIIPTEKELPKENPHIKDIATISPRRLQFSPKISKINEENLITDEKEDVILEGEDFCVCTLEKDKDTTQNSHRSISFSEAREVFNRQQNETKSLIKMREKVQERKNDEEIQQSPKKENKEAYEKGKTEGLEEKNNNPDQITDTENTENVTEENENSFVQNSNQKYKDEPKLSELNKKSSQISLLGAFYNQDEQETHTSYQDFRENELYAVHPKINSSENDKIRDTARIHFPPPPFESYKSIDDLNGKEDEESLYEEAEDFIWQNEIYESLVDQNETKSTTKNNEKKFSNVEKNLESDDELYEEVSADFVYKKNDETREDEDIYSEPNFRDFSRISCPDSIGSISEMYEEENELYEETDKIRNFNQNNNNKKLDRISNDKVNEIKSHMSKTSDVQFENELYAEPKEFSIEYNEELQLDNEIYGHSNKTETVMNKNIPSEEFQMDNEIYAEPNINILKTNEETQKTGHENQLKSIEDDRKKREEMGEESKQNKEDQLNTFLENEIYAEPSLVFLRERHSSVESEANVYEDPDQLRSEKKEKKMKQQNSEEIRKQDSFIQRLLKHVTRKPTGKNSKSMGSPPENTEETLKLLGDIQVLLEKKKQFIKEMVQNEKSASGHRRILSEANAQIKSKDGINPLMRTYSIDVNDEYSVVRDCLQEDNEVIYSEVEMIDRSSKELKDLIEDLLKHYKESSEEKG